MRAYDFRFSFGDHRLFCVGPSCVLISANSSINHSIHYSFSSADGLYRSNDPFDSWRAATTLLEKVTYLWAYLRHANVKHVSFFASLSLGLC